MRMKAKISESKLSSSLRQAESQFSGFRSGLGSALDSGAIASVQKKFEGILAKQIRAVEAAHRQELRNVEAVAVEDAARFLKRHTERVTRALTREHHKLIQQFMDYKDRIDEYVSGLDKSKARMTAAELLTA